MRERERVFFCCCCWDFWNFGVLSLTPMMANRGGSFSQSNVSAEGV